MAYDEELNARVAEVVGPWEATRNAMFGGSGYFLGGNMLAGIDDDDMVLWLSRAKAHAESLPPK